MIQSLCSYILFSPPSDTHLISNQSVEHEISKATQSARLHTPKHMPSSLGFNWEKSLGHTQAVLTRAAASSTNTKSTFLHHSCSLSKSAETIKAKLPDLSTHFQSMILQFLNNHNLSAALWLFTETFSCAVCVKALTSCGSS